ncbi:hypothetical protein F5141DRAFT_1013069, partial [Pisolithus sp. B1]
YVSAKATKPYPLSVWSFTSQLLAFINTHIATKNESMLAALGTLPGKSVMLYASTEVLVNVHHLWMQTRTCLYTTVSQQTFRELHGDECTFTGSVLQTSVRLTSCSTSTYKIQHTRFHTDITRITLPSTSSTNVAEGSTHLPDPRHHDASFIMNAIFSVQKRVSYLHQRVLVVSR